MTSPSEGSVLVIVPTYNEAANIAAIVGKIRASAPEADVLIVDDNSPDGTGAIAAELAGLDHQVHVLNRTAKEGLGVAYVNAFRWGLDRGYDVLVEMDADGSHQPEELPKLLRALEDADLVIGSRYVQGGRVVNWARRRELLSRMGNTYVRIAVGTSLRDTTSGYRAFRADTLRQTDLGNVASQGYCFQVDLAWRAVRSGLHVVEVPITFVERVEGESKMDVAIAREALLRITAWGARHRVAQIRSLITGRRQ